MYICLYLQFQICLIYVYMSLFSIPNMLVVVCIFCMVMFELIPYLWQMYVQQSKAVNFGSS